MFSENFEKLLDVMNTLEDMLEHTQSDKEITAITLALTTLQILRHQTVNNG